MKQFLLLSSFVTLASCLFAQAHSVNGHWRRMDILFKQDDPSNKQPYGDLIIAQDSTYTVIGNEAAQQTKIPGWNTSETMSGKWVLHGKNYLDFYVNDLPAPLVYKIIRLTKAELHLQSNYNGAPVMKYKRIE